MVLHCFADAIGADTATLVACRPGPGANDVTTWTREGRSPDDSSPPPPTLANRVLDSGGALAEASPEGDDPGGHRAVAAAVHSLDGVIGAIHAGFESPSHQSRDELTWAADSYARLAALCMSDDAMVPAALGSASVDPLTGCLTFGAVIEVLSAELQRSEHHMRRVSVCMIDLDGFRRVNEICGSIEGNRVLSAVGAALRSVARRYDAVGRIAADQFVIVMPETGDGDGTRFAHRFHSCARSAVAETTHVHADVSIGIVEWDGDVSPLVLVRQADEAMREAKRHGGAQVRSLPPGGSGASVALSLVSPA